MPRAREAFCDDPPARALLDLLLTAGELAYRLPEDDINLRHVSGRRDPRVRVLRTHAAAWRRAAGPRATWGRTALRLARRLARTIERRGAGADRPLRILLQYAPTGLAPDGRVPTDPVLRAGWNALVHFFGIGYPTAVVPLDALPGLDARRLHALRRDASRGLRVGRVASGRRPGRRGCELAVDARLCRAVARAVGRDVSPGLVAKYLYYTKPRDHTWPHADDPGFTVNLLVCVDRALPNGSSSGSALLTYGPRGAVHRHEIEPGSAVAMECGVVHAREPLRHGERLVLLSILYR